MKEEKIFKICPVCKASVRDINYDYHMAKVHGIGSLSKIPKQQSKKKVKLVKKRPKTREILKKYKMYRKIGIELNHKIIDSSLSRDVLMKSGRLLGITRGNTFIFDSEDETSVLMDFAMNEYRVNDKNTVEIYLEKIGWKNETEKDILDALLSSYTSLFKVISISEVENTLLLSDILNKKDNIKLIDIAFSKTAIPGLLLFIRLVPFKDFNMTSGVSFLFPGDLERYLLRRYKKLSRKVKSDSNSIKRFVSFYKLSKTDGIEVGFV